MSSNDPRDIDTGSIITSAIGEHRQTKWRYAAALMGVVAVAAVVFAVTDYAGQRDDAQAGEKDAKQVTQVVGDSATSLADRVLVVCQGVSGDAVALRDAGLCGKASVTKQQVQEATPGSPGSPGSTGATGGAGLPGVQGQQGEPGLVGPAGPMGSPGSAGAPGDDAPPGQPGTPGMPGQDGAPGAPGEPGTDGKDGADGRSIQSAQCGDDGRWTVTYTDGTSEDAGVCRVDPLPAPDQP